MTIWEMKERLSVLTGITDENLLLTYLEQAGQIVLNRRYPFPNDETEVPERYHAHQVRIAEFMLAKRGAPGQIVHNENGVNRTWANSDIPDDLFKGIVPVGKVLR